MKDQVDELTRRGIAAAAAHSLMPAADAGAVLASIKALTPRPIRCIITTGPDADHVGGLPHHLPVPASSAYMRPFTP